MFIIVVCIIHVGPSIVNSSVVSILTECADFVKLSLSYKVCSLCINIGYHFIITIAIKVHSCQNAGNLVSVIYLCINECDTMRNGTVDSTVTRSVNYYDISTYFIVRDMSIDEIWNASFVLKHSNEFGRAMRHFEVDGELVYHTKHYTLTSLSSHSPPSFSLSPHSLSPHTLSISPLPSLSLSLSLLPSPLSPSDVVTSTLACNTSLLPPRSYYTTTTTSGPTSTISTQPVTITSSTASPSDSISISTSSSKVHHLYISHYTY